MATQRGNKGTSSAHGKATSGKSKSSSSSSEKNRNGSRGGSSRQSASARHGRESRESSGQSKGASANKGSESSPQQEQGGMVSRAAGGVKDAGSKVADSVKQHPIAASAIGMGIAAGLTYMAVRAIQGASAAQDQAQDEGQDQGNDEGMEDQGDAEMSSQTEGEEDEGGDEDEEGSEDDEDDPGLMRRTRNALSSVGGRIGGAMRNGASAVGQTAGEGYRAGKETLGGVWENHPVAVGAGILAMGLAAGMLLPSTKSEKRLFGGSSGKLTGRFKSAGQELLEQGKEIASKVVSEAGETLREEAEREGLTPDRLSRKVKRIAGKLKDAVVNAATE
jgi:hypothetical protein